MDRWVGLNSKLLSCRSSQILQCVEINTMHTLSSLAIVSNIQTILLVFYFHQVWRLFLFLYFYFNHAIFTLAMLQSSTHINFRAHKIYYEQIELDLFLRGFCCCQKLLVGHFTNTNEHFAMNFVIFISRHYLWSLIMNQVM